jgi:hypothetical protein
MSTNTSRAISHTRIVSSSASNKFVMQQLLILFSSMLMATACAPRPPRVASFDVSPQHICEGTRVAVSWEVQYQENTSNRRTTLTIGSGAPIVVEDTAGNRTIPVPVSSDITVITSDSEGFQNRTIRAEVIPASGLNYLIQGSTSCASNVLKVTTELPNNEWDRRIRISTITAGNPGRIITIQHMDSEGTNRSSSIPGGTSTDDFHGMTLGGVWVISSQMAINEVCSSGETGQVRPDTSNRIPAPSSLSATVSAVCSAQ